MSRQSAERAGRKAEAEAADWLRAQGWDIIAERRKTSLGEIDLIARREGLTVFVEVKWRRDSAALDHAIDASRLSRVAAAAEAIAHEYAAPGDDLRIDVILLAPGASPRHIVNAWQP